MTRSVWSQVVISAGLVFAASPMSAIGQVTADAHAFRPENVSATTLECSRIPTLEEVRTGRLHYTDRYFSSHEALKLGFPIVNFNANRDYLVIVRDILRYKTCLATDNLTELRYGQVVRAVVEVLTVEGSASVNAVSIAIDGTLRNRAQFFYLYTDGIWNPEIPKAIAEISGKAFNVENYGLYQGLIPRILPLFDAGETQLGVNLIGVETPPEDPEYTLAAVRAYALSQILQGRKLTVAQGRFQGDPGRVGAIASTYQFVMGSDFEESPREGHKEKARNLLAGLRVN